MNKQFGELSVTEYKVYNFIITYQEENLFPPTMREIAEGVGLKSTSSVSYLLDKLEEHNLIKMNKQKGSRAIKLSNFKIIKEEGV